MPDRAPLVDVLRSLSQMRDAGTPVAQAVASVQQLGWSPDEVKAAVGQLQPSGYGERAASGLTFGLVDEARSLGGAVGRQLRGLTGGDTAGESFGQSYGAARDRVLSEQELGRQRQGGLGTAAELAGGLAAPIPFARGAATLPEAVLRGAGGGAIAGAAQGAGSGEGGQDRLNRGVLGAAVGGALGGAAAPVVDLVAKVGTARMPAASRATARGLLDSAIADEGTTGAQLAGAIEQANAAGKTGVTPADVGGARLRGLVEDIAQSPNPAQDAITAQLGGRQYGQGERIIGDLQQLGGVQGRTYTAQAEDIIKRRSADARPQFARAFGFDTASSPAVRDAFAELMQTAAGPQAYKRAVQIAKNEQPRFTPPKLSDLIGPDGQLAAVPNMQFMHYMKMGLDDLHGSAVRGTTGMGATVARSVANVRNTFRDTLAAANPDYGEALSMFSSHSALKDALEAGREMFPRPAEEVQAAMAQLGGPAEEEMFRLGALSRLTQTIAGKRRGPTADVAGALRDVPDVEAKLNMLLPPGARDALAQRLAAESGMSRTARQAIGGSPTARRLAQSDEAEGDALLGQATSSSAKGLPTSVAEALFALIRPLAGPVAAYAKSQRRGELGRMLGMTDARAAAMLRGLGQSFRLPLYPSGAAGPRAVSGLASLLPPPPPPPWFYPQDRR